MSDMRDLKRISARLRPEIAYKLTRIREETGSNMSEVICRAIELYFAESVSSRDRGWEALSEVGFVGCAEGDADLSTRYKDDLNRSLPKKI